jgi:DNA-directed RNA polymerase specialized sigma24 family protein
MKHKLVERGRRSDSHLQETEVKEHHQPFDPEPQFVAHGTLQDALERLRRLDPLRYQIVILRDVHGASWQEIATAVDLSDATVRYRHQAAYAWLRTQLGADKSSPG